MQRARAIGEAHRRIGLEPRWYIGGYNLILNRLTDIAIREYRWRPQRLIGTLQAIQRALMLDMDLAISVYNTGAANAERDRRRGRIDELIEEFEGRVGDLIGGCTSATTDLQDFYEVVTTHATTGDSRVGSVARYANLQAHTTQTF